MGSRYLGLIVLIASACQGTEAQLGEVTQATIVMSPDGHDFGSFQVGNTSSPMGFNVGPYDQYGYDEVHAIVETCPDFAVDAPYLPAAIYFYCEYEYDPCQPYGNCPYCASYQTVSYNFSATFTPVAGGPTSCAVYINGPAGTLGQITLYGTGTLPPVDWSVSPGSVGFGDVRRNTTSGPATVTVYSTGGQQLNVSSVSVTGPFTVTGPTAYGLTPNNNQAHTVHCQPTVLGGVGGTLTIQSNDPDTPTVNIPLTCNGIDSNLDVSPSPAIISTTRVGEPSSQLVTLQNTGAASMSLESVTLINATDMTLTQIPSPQVLGQGGSVQARVQFGAAASGDATGTLVVTYDGGQQRMTQVSARALATSMTVNPDGDLDLGPVCVGQSTSKPLTIRANDQGGFRINSISSLAAPLAITTPNLPVNVQGNGQNTISMMIHSAPTTVGPSTQTLTITTDIPNAAPRTIDVSTTALPAGISPSPALVELGATTVGATTLAKSVNVTNCSTGSISLSNARIEGTDAGDFAIVLPPASLSIASTTTATWLIVFRPQSGGSKQATFSVDTPDGTVTVMLAAEGLATAPEDIPPEDNAGVRPSYYACAAGGAGGGGWLLAGAIVLALRRRRHGTTR